MHTCDRDDTIARLIRVVGELGARCKGPGGTASHVAAHTGVLYRATVTKSAEPSCSSKTD